MHPPASKDGYYCPRCTKRVYYAEEVIALGHHWHKACFTCANPQCNKRLDSRSCADHNGDAYCIHCHKKMFGPKGYGYGIGAGTLSTDLGQQLEPTTTPTDQLDSHGRDRDATLYFTNTRAQVTPLMADLSGGGSRSPSAQSTGTSSSSSHLSSIDSPLSPVNGHYRIVGARQISVGGGGKPHQQRDMCGRCGKPVYQAEKMIAGGTAWHKMACFTCANCNKKLESTTLCERQGEIFCKTCYGKNYGPKGYGYGIGAGTLQMQQ